MGQQLDGYEMPADPRQQEYNLASIAILRRMLAKEITPEQAKKEQAQLTERYPEFKTPVAPEPEAPAQPISDEEYQRRMNDLYAEPTNAHEDIGYHGKQSSSDEIPAAAKAAMNHRSACGEKLSDKDLARFWKKINVKNPKDCWEWINSTRGSLGYGQFRIGSRICDAHRIALELKSGPLKKGRYVCHNCDNPKCCNPHHLFGGTQKENMDDMTNKGRGNN